MAENETRSGGKGSGSILKGLKTRSPSVDDASRKVKGGSVNDGATRSETAKTPATIGPRCA